MNVLHISDTTLSGAPYRLACAQNKYSDLKAKHLVWKAKIFDRVFPTDLVGEDMSAQDLRKWWDWADIIHWHNRRTRSVFFKKTQIDINKKPSVFQIHSPRNSEDFDSDINAEVPLLIIAQYHPREWPDKPHKIVPNIIDIHDELLTPPPKTNRTIPIVTYAPSNVTAKGWDDKGYTEISPTLKKLKLARKIDYRLIIKKTYEDAMKLKRLSDIGIDECKTGSYHLSSLEYLSMGVATICYIDKQTEKVVKDITGCPDLPWVNCNAAGFQQTLTSLINNMEKTSEYGLNARKWMQVFWNPAILCTHYISIYEAL